MVPEVSRPICLFAIFMQHSAQILFSASKIVRYCLIVQIGPQERKKNDCLQTTEAQIYLPIQPQHWILSQLSSRFMFSFCI